MTFLLEGALFGIHRVKEYGVGVLRFPDFLKSRQLSDSEDHQYLSYYEKCSEITLARQVGSRYFVTASNAGKILFFDTRCTEIS